MINAETAEAVERIAAVRGFEAAALKAFIQTESAGITYATVDGKKEPLIRWEGHYFHRLCAPTVRDKAIKAGLASPRAGGIPNPSSQQARWDKLLKPAMAIDKQAALESCSWGIGQVMGSHWKMLGFSSVLDMVDTARSGVEGQIELMVRFLEKTGLKGALARHDWKTVASGYNGANYAANKYDEKMADAYAEHNGKGKPSPSRDGAVLLIQRRLVAHGYPMTVDGVRGPKTDEAIKAFQKAKGLTVDGVVGRFTMEALNAGPAVPIITEADKIAVSNAVIAQGPVPEGGWLAALLSVIAKAFARK